MRLAAGTWLFLAAALSPLAAKAAMETATESASYAMSDNDSRTEARQKCADAAKRIALDRAGSVFEATMTTSKADGHGAVDDDAQIKMRSYFAAVVSSEVVRTQMDVFGDATRMSCDVKITYDPDAVTRKLAEIADAEGLRKQVAAQQATIADLQDRAKQSNVAPVPASAFPPSNYPPPPTYAASAPYPQTAANQPPGAVPANYQPPIASVPTVNYPAPQMAYAPPPAAIRVQAAPPVYAVPPPVSAGFVTVVPYPQVAYAAPIVQLPHPRPAALAVYRPHWRVWARAYRQWNRVR